MQRNNFCLLVQHMDVLCLMLSTLHIGLNDDNTVFSSSPVHGSIQLNSNPISLSSIFFSA